jgi:hypothetical protein
MAKTTLLELTQGILSVADGDEVNSISDTIESDQCARVIRDEYNIIADEFDLKMSETLTQLTATGASTPIRMDRPEGFHSIETIWYDKRLLVGDDPNFEEIIFQDPETFLKSSMSLNASDTDVSTLTLTDSGHTLNFRNNRAPTYWTILEGYDEIYFDSFDGDLETNLQASKSLVKGVQRPTLALTDAAVPDLPENLMVLLRNRAQAFYFDVYKDGTTREIDKRQRHSEVRSQRKKYVTKKLQQQRTGPNYGRKA